MTAISPRTSGASIFSAAPEIAPPPGSAEWDAYLSHHGRSFWMAARLIPSPQRARLAGVYAWCRYTDDLVDHAACSRLTLLGVLREYRNAGVDALMYHWIWEKGCAKGYSWAEAGWVLEDNAAMWNGISRLGFVPYKTYRIYDKSL